MQEGGQTSQVVLPNCQQRELEAGAAASVLWPVGQAVAGGSAFPMGLGSAHPDRSAQPPSGRGSGGGRESREIWKPAWRHRRVEVGSFRRKPTPTPTLGGSDGKESACKEGDPGFTPRVGKIPWRRQWLFTPAFLPRESHGQRSLMGYIQSMGLHRVRHD